ncbi:MAG: adhesin/invasin, partial [Gemmatimonadales bacterium]|nr:adhesin/invasin [Gemmatimonadales bacterium]
MTISHPRSLVLGLSLLLASCGGEGLILPPDGAPAHIEIAEGSNGQSARVGSTLAESLVVLVTDTQDRPVAGANVVFEFTADGAAASPATVNTDADGRAASRLAVGTRPGPVTGLVSVPVDPGVTPVQDTITALVLPDNANGIALLSGDDQTGQIGTTLAAPLVVVVTDALGNPIPGFTVGWTVNGGGSVNSASTTTVASGQASVTRTLGTTAGTQTAVATATGLAGSPVTFTHTATAGTATGVTKVSGDGQSGSPGAELALPLVVQVLDAAGNPIPNR